MKPAETALGICDICSMDCTSLFLLNKHLAIVHFKKEITSSFQQYFNSHENTCKQCPEEKSHPGVSAKLIHIGTVHEMSTQLLNSYKSTRSKELVTDIVKEETSLE